MANVVRSEFPTTDDNYTIWPVRHNWSESFTLSMEFLTNIITSSDGTEQRRAVRDKARFSCNMSVVMDWESRRALEDALTRRFITDQGGFRGGIMVALDCLPINMAENMAPEEEGVGFTNKISDPTLPPFWLEAGMDVLLVDRDRPWVRETRTLQSISATTANFNETSEGNFVRWSWVFPCYRALWPDGQAIQLLSSQVGQQSSIDIRFRVQDFQSIPETGTQFALGAQEFFQPEPNWGGEAEANFIWPYNLQDYGYGSFAVDSQVKFPSRVYKFEYMFKTVEEAFAIMGFFQRHRGRCKHFFFSTWQDDIKVRAIQGGGSNLVVDGQRLGATYHSAPQNTVYKRVMVQYIDGTFTHHKIESVDELPDTVSSVVRLQDTLPVGTHVSDIERVSWVLNGRFATDRLDCEFMSAGTGRITVPIQSLRNAEL